MKKLVIFIIVGFVVAAGAFWAYRRSRPPVPAEVTVDQSGGEGADKALSEVFKKISETDKDLDGLTDAEEKKYGTDPAKADTDGDGVLDKDEIAIYRSNPLKADTDGDGVKDGAEVRRGLNPNGAGKLSL